ncbi:glycosyltransferase family 9 protein [Agrobacterium sp. NPDC090273]|uniref:glycosyltransferase family 9 protein n=1 Tax=Agrobacterium sp. NPDC090273 TaxID=3363919 RepID=UPI00383B8B2D
MSIVLRGRGGLFGPRTLNAGPSVPRQPRKILVIKPDKIGDFVLALSAMTHLRETFHDAELHLLAGPWNQTFAEQTRLFDVIHFIPANIGSSQPGSREFESVAELLPHFDLAVDLRVEDDQRGYIFAIDAHTKAAYAGKKGHTTFDIEPPFPRKQSWANQMQDIHASTLMNRLAREVSGYYKDSILAQSTLLNLTQSIDPDTQTLLNEFGRGSKDYLVGINCGSGAETRDWPEEYFLTLINQLIVENDALCLLVGGPDEIEKHSAIESALPRDRVLNLTAKIDLADLPSVLLKLSLYVGNDTGTTHMAACLGVPTVCIYAGVTSIGRFAAKGEKTITVTNIVPCSPCGVSLLKECVGGHACMRGISVDRVIDAALRITNTQNDPKSNQS